MELGFLVPTPGYWCLERGNVEPGRWVPGSIRTGAAESGLEV